MNRKPTNYGCGAWNIGLVDWFENSLEDFGAGGEDVDSGVDGEGGVHTGITMWTQQDYEDKGG